MACNIPVNVLQNKLSKCLKKCGQDLGTAEQSHISCAKISLEFLTCKSVHVLAIITFIGQVYKSLFRGVSGSSVKAMKVLSMEEPRKAEEALKHYFPQSQQVCKLHRSCAINVSRVSIGFVSAS